MTVKLLVATVVLAGAWVAVAEDYPQWLGPKRDNVIREPNLAPAFPAGGPKVVWRAEVAGGYSQPAVAGGKVVVTDRVAKPSTERITCLDEASGKVLWRVEYPCEYTISYGSGPRTTPVIEDGRVYTLGGMGDVYCVALQSGKVLWNKKLGGKPAIWGYAGSPVIEGEMLILLSSGKPLVTALNKGTGAVVWESMEAGDPGYVPPTPMTLAGKRQIVQYHPNGIAGIDVADGKVLWELPYGPEQNGVTIVTPVQLSADTFLVSSNWTGMAAVQVGADQKAKFLWHVKGKSQGVPTLQSLHSPMSLWDGHVYGVHKDGQLVCVRANDGQVVWSQTKPVIPEGQERLRWGTGFLTAWQPEEGKPPRHYYLAADSGDLILCHLSPAGYKEVSRAHLLAPTNAGAGRPVLWSNPAYANGSVFWRNDRELIRVRLTGE